ncbi:glycosyltransferase family 2 protein [Oscillatoria amoena NRMC-F 0135]|nr:glycosyltransferase family 2 protein [Geitlerinema splendidum]MDL5046861.1 glycosyltransferase family 2 protein [Oscillatoria amoena NRMC-F 0135]
MNKPLFSIVIPTRNRAHLLRSSLHSALSQDFDDYEVVVINNNCHDDTDLVVQSFKSEKLQYFHTSQTLSMPDNWEFAWSKARGKYVLYLCDDDALLPTTLSFITKHILPQNPKVVTWNLIRYNHPNWVENENQQSRCFPLEDRNTLVIPIENKVFEKFSSKILLEKLYKFEESIWFPRMLNCCVEKQAIDRIREKLGSIFIPICPDYSFMSTVLHLCSEIYVVYKPLAIWGVSPSSIGATQHRQGNHGKAAKEFSKEFGEYNFYEDCPVDIPIVPNYIASTLLRRNKTLLDAGFEPQEIDWSMYFVCMASALNHLQENIPCISDYRVTLIKAAYQYSLESGQVTENILETENRPALITILNYIGKFIQSSQLLCRLELAIRHKNNLNEYYRFLRLDKGILGHRNLLIIQGDEIGASSITDMANVANLYFEKYKKVFNNT